MADVIEMRTYKISAGKREEFLDIFTATCIPEQRRVGMKVLGPFISVDDAHNTITQRWEPQDTFFWMRSFPDLEARDEMKRAFYEGHLWKTEYEQQIMPLIDEMDAVLVVDMLDIPDTWVWPQSDGQ
jgi:hypothetical protein